jgi:RNA polymerase sigma factor (sigma-70 family)
LTTDLPAERVSGPVNESFGAPAPVGLAALFRLHHAELVRLAVLLVRDLPTAEDVVQDVFTRIHARSGGPLNPESALAYLRAAELNGCRSVLRHRAVARRLGIGREGRSVPGAAGPGDTWDADHGGGPGGWARQGSGSWQHESAEHAALRAEDRRQVLAALAALPTRRREVLVLRYYLGLSEAEIARTLGISTGSVKSSASRGIAALARALGEES